MSKKKEMPIDALRELLVYIPDTGELQWRVSRRGCSCKAGNPAGGPHWRGYWRVVLSGRSYMGHRLAWALTHGYWPKDEIDHINGDRRDNRLSNLREATRAENAQNLSGVKGCYYRERDKRWIARIGVGGPQKHLGSFLTEQEAREAYLKAKAALHAFNPTPREELG